MNARNVCLAVLTGASLAVAGVTAAPWTNLTTLSASANSYYSLAVRSDGSVWGWGTNRYGELGTLPAAVPFPRRIDGFTNAVAVAAGGRHSLALLADGRVFAWGYNYYGELGNNSTANSSTPVQVSGLTNAIAIAAGGYHSLAVLADGTVRCWGDNSQGGQLGIGGGGGISSVPVTPSGTSVTNVIAFAAGTYHSLALRADGTVWAWGLNDGSQLGNGTGSTVYCSTHGCSGSDAFSSPTQVQNMTNATAIAAGRNQSLAVRSDGSLWVWGWSAQGELGTGVLNDEYPWPIQLTALSNMVSVAGSINNSLAADAQGNVFVWGYDGFSNQPLVPTQIDKLPPIQAVAQGYYHGLGIAADGSVYNWGDNTYWQFGNDTYTATPGGLSPRYSTGPYPTSQPGEFSRGNLDTPDFTSFVVPLTQQRGVRLDSTGADSYKFGLMTPWINRVRKTTRNQAAGLTNGTQVVRLAVENPSAAFGSELGGTPIYPGPGYGFGVYAGGLDESDSASTNTFRILVYSRDQFASGTNGIVPLATNIVAMPRRAVSADAAAWSNFVQNAWQRTNSAYGLNTTVEFVDGENASGYKSWGLSWQGGVLANFRLAGYKLTHSATDTATNYHYVIEGLGSVPTGPSTRAHFAETTNAQWIAVPLYTLDFESHPPLRALFLDQPQFDGVPLPPTYAGKAADDLAFTASLTNSIWLTNNTAYTNLDDSPELRQHPALDKVVSDLNSDPLRLASFVINEIDLVDPLGLGSTNSTSLIVVNQGGVSRSALGTLLERQGSPAEQCALLVYLLRKAGYSAAYVWPTNNNLLMLESRLSRLFRMQVKAAPDYTGQGFVYKKLVQVQYPWVAANVGGRSLQIFPWLKDTQISDGLNLYDYLPPAYNSGYKWAKSYITGDTNLLNLDPVNNTPLSLFPRFISQCLQTNAPGLSLDDIGVHAFNRRVQYARWEDLPMPNVLQNQSQLAVLTNLSASQPFLTNLFATFQVQVYAGAGTNGAKVMDTGPLRTADLQNRRFLLLTNSPSTLELWLAPYRLGVGATLQFTNDAALLNTQKLTHALSGQSTYTVVMNEVRQPAVTASYWGFLGIDPVVAFQYGPMTLNASDIAAISLNLGRVTQPMLQLQADAYMQAARQRAANTNAVIALEDYQGTVACLLGLNFFKQESDFMALSEQLHKVKTLSENCAGLAKLVRGGSTNFQAAVDIQSGFLLGAPHLDEPSGTVRLDIREDEFTSWENFLWLWVAGASAEEHHAINTTLEDKYAISTVRLLQLAQRRATNGNAGPLELTRSNYVAVGNSTQPGWGSTKVKDQDPSIWSSVTNAFNAWDADYARVFLTPGIVTNETGAYKGMGAFTVGRDKYGWVALISGQSVPLRGGFGDFGAWFDFNGEDLNYTLGTSPDGGVALHYTDPTGNAADDVPVFDPWSVLGLDSSSASHLTPGANLAASQAASLYNSSDLALALQLSTDAGNPGRPSYWDTFFTTASDPVNVISGEFYIDTVDLTLPGPMPLQVRRNYQSQNLSGENNLGYGWKMSFVPYLTVVTNTNNVVLLHGAEPDGSVIAYRKQTNDVYLAQPQDNPMLNNDSVAGIGSVGNWFNASIVRYTNNGTIFYALHAPDGSLRTYRQRSDFGVTNGTSVLSRVRPYLDTWQDHRGNTLTLSFGTNSLADDYGQVNRVQSSNGDFLGFNYDSYGRVVEAYTGDGRRVTYEYDSFGDLTTATLPDQAQFTYEYQHVWFNVTNGAAVTTNLDSNHLLVKEYKPEGRTLQNVFDNQRRVIAQLATVGVDMSLYTNAVFTYNQQYDDTNNTYFSTLTGQTQVRDILGNTTTYQYGGSLITSITDPLTFTIRQDWWPTNATAPGFPRSLQRTIDKRGLVTNYQYDNRGNVTNLLVYATNTVTGLVADLTGDGTTSLSDQAAYTTNNLPLVTVDALGNQVQYVYSTSDPWLAVQIIRCAGATPVSTNSFDYTNVTNTWNDGVHWFTNRASGLVQRVVRGGGATSEWTYDGRGFASSQVQYPATTDCPSTDPAVTNYYLYNERGELIQTTNALGWKTLMAYDPVGRPEGREVYDQSGQALFRHYTYYNGNGQVSWIDGPRSNPEDYLWCDYDGAGRVITEIHWRSRARADGSGVEAETGDDLYATTFHAYDGFGNETNTIFPLGNSVWRQWDQLGRKTNEVFYSAGGVALASNEFGYEPGGQVAVAFNALGAGTTNVYNVAGRLVARLNPDGSTNAWRYDLRGRVVQEILPSGNYWQTDYDDLNLRVNRSFKSAGGAVLGSGYTQLDTRGNAVQKSDLEGNVFTNLFDGLDRLKLVAGPAIITVNFAMDLVHYDTNINQQLTAYTYDACGQTVTTANALGEKMVTTRDALGRPIQVAFYASGSGTPLRVTSTAYSPDHQSVTVTSGTGPTAIVRTTWTDTEGHPVLEAGYPSAGVREYTWRQFDRGGNRLAENRCSANGRTVTVWQTNGWSYDGLNRVVAETSRDGAVTLYYRDALGNVTNRSMPNGLAWSASYQPDGRLAAEQETGNGLPSRSMSYAYYPAGSPFAGLLQSVTDGRGTTRSNSYDDFLRVASVTTSGSAAEQQTSTTRQYDGRNLLTNLVQSFASSDTGPDTTVSRAFDCYGQLVQETVAVGDEVLSDANQTWEAAGRRSRLDYGLQNIGFIHRADGLMVAADGSTFGYGDNGLLTGRTNAARVYTIPQRDGVGRVLQTMTKVLFSTNLSETLTWRSDGRLSGYTAIRSGTGGFTDTRNYTYAPWSERVAQESFSVSGSQRLTNNYAFDNGQAGGLGVLTTIGAPAQSTNTWSAPASGGLDGLSRVSQETTAILRRPATGLALGAAKVSATLDGNPVGVQFDGTEADGRWQASLDLVSGSHTLRLSAMHPSGLYTAYATNSFTVTAGADSIGDQFDGNGNVSKRSWVNSDGQTNRTQTLTWDAFDRLIMVSDRDSDGSGQDWVAVFDGLGRKVRTMTTLVVSNTPITSPADAVSTVDSWFDPLVEFQEVGVVVNDGYPAIKTYGPDANGVYGGLNGVGGLERIEVYGQMTPVGIIQDYFGNVVGTITNLAVAWNPARFSSYGPVPGYQQSTLSLNTPLAQSVGWRGKHIESIGIFYWGARPYEPASGRFLSLDLAGDAANPGGYSIGGGDLVNCFDPSARNGVSLFQVLAPVTYSATGARPYTGSLAGDVAVAGAFYGATLPIQAPGLVYTSEPVQRGMQVIGGASEVFAGAYAIPGSGGFGTTVGLAAIGHGLDSIQAGIFGQQSFTAQGFTWATGSPTWGSVLDAGIGVTLNIGAGVMRPSTVGGDVIHLTSSADAELIGSSGRIGGEYGVFGVQAGAVPDSQFGRMLLTGLGDRSTPVFVSGDAATAFQSPAAIGPFSALRDFFGVRSTPLGSVDLRTGEFIANEVFNGEGFAQASFGETLAYYGHETLLNIPDILFSYGRISMAYGQGEIFSGQSQGMSLGKKPR